ncbi:S-adenosyl-L-methionine-dependent methyltransferase [Aspergillus granulosus]|uniref:S-adenosyl-L-methionine-dependent methyltransferase n=1 Tax=Aspergillus granulosus TaxID=176169 RepID=A0ABR4GX46_9EURO
MVNSPYANMDDLANAVAESVHKYLDSTGQARHGLFQDTKSGERDPGTKRLALQHQLFHLTLDGKLYLSPLPSPAQSVLDIATGDATWVHAFAEQNPSAYIVANDPNSTHTISPGLSVISDPSDANKTWTYTCKFDLIHCRQHHRRLDEPRLFEQAFNSLTPGGWLEMQELSNPVTSDDGTLSENSPLSHWGRLLIEASNKMNRPVDNPAKYETWMREAGFVNCHTVVYKWPTNTWPADEKGKMLGLWNLFNILQRFEEFSMALLVKVLGWEGDYARGFLGKVKGELMNGDVHGYWPVYVVYGQKPPAGSVPGSANSEQN